LTVTHARRPVVDTVEELLAGATSREPVGSQALLTGGRRERVRIGGQPFLLERFSRDDDWVLRATGDLACRPLLVWRSGLLDRLPAVLDHGVVAAARDGRGVALLLEDVSPWLVGEGDAPIPLEQHLRFVDHLAALHAAMWGFEDTIGLAPLSARYLELSPWVAGAEARRGAGPIPRLIGHGWQTFVEVSERAADLVIGLLREPWPLLAALEETPATLVHGDWQLSNLGSRPDGRTVALGWTVTGRGPACSDLAWYLARNGARLPQSRDETIAGYRGALERHGIDTAGWWERQLGLCLLGGLVQFGWLKAARRSVELRWWEDRAMEGARWLAW
jgi:Phosphotransferase enzyme family